MFSILGESERAILSHTVGKRVNVVLRGRSVRHVEIIIENNEATHDPEKPSLHRSKRHPDTGVLVNVHGEEDRNPECRVEIAEDETERSEERLHRQESQVNDQVVGPKASGRPVETRHEVDHDVVDKHPSSRERKICKHVGDRVGCSSVHTEACLCVCISTIAISEDDFLQLTCLSRILRPTIISPTSPCESKTTIKGPTNRRVARTNPPAPVSGRLR